MMLIFAYVEMLVFHIMGFSMFFSMYLVEVLFNEFVKIPVPQLLLELTKL